MTELEKAARQALEALGYWQGEASNYTEQYAAYHALRTAIEQAETAQGQEPVAWCVLEPWLSGKFEAQDCFSDVALDANVGWVPLYTTPPAAPVQEPVAFDFQKALKRAYHLGQNYWADADSESYSANKRAEKHRQAFEALCEEALNSQTVTRTAATKIRKYEPTIDLGKYAGTYGGYIKENDND